MEKKDFEILLLLFFFYILFESIVRKIFDCQRDKFILLLQIYYIYRFERFVMYAIHRV